MAENINQNETFSSVLIIGGAGQVGQLFGKTISGAEILVKESQKKSLVNKKIALRVSTNLLDSLKRKPELIILATANPIDEVVSLLAKNLNYSPTIILPQNGVGVVAKAVRIFEQSKKKCNFIRASLFTVISSDTEGNAVYNKDKLRIALAETGVGERNVDKAKAMFARAGFDARVYEDYKSLEWTKLVVNSLGTTAVITGLTPRETFRDEKLFEIEAKGIKDRMEIMQAAGIKFAKIPWQNISLLPKLRYVPMKTLQLFRFQLAEIVSKGRNDQPPAASRKIAENKPTEIAYYLKPFIELGIKYGFKPYADEVIMEIISDHESGKINLKNLSENEKREKLIELYKKYLKKPYIPRSPVVTEAVEALYGFFCRELKVTGAENLEKVRKSLDENRSVIILANHSSHADHPTLVHSLIKSGYSDLANRIVFVAGMKFKNEMISRFLSDAYARVVVSTPTNEILSEEENRQAQEINLKGFLKINKLLNQGNLLVIYPEGTRSRDGKLLKAIPMVARYFENQNIKYLLPVGMLGTQDLLPVGRTIPKFAKMAVTIGEPIEPAKLIKRVTDAIPEREKEIAVREKTLRGKVSERVIDQIMKTIASMLPAEKRGYYK